MLNFDAIWTADAAPLTEAEETELLRYAQAGDHDAITRLLVAYRPLMLAVIRSYDPFGTYSAGPTGQAGRDVPAVGGEDFYSAAILGVIAAIQVWDEGISPRLSVAREYVTDEVAKVAGMTTTLTVTGMTLKRFFSIARRSGYNLEVGLEIAPE